MWRGGPHQFIPFIATLLSIVLTDLLTGTLIGLGVSVLFILNNNLRRPVRRVVRTNLGAQVTHVELANQVSFINKAAIDKILTGAGKGTHLLIDARDTDYIDPDVLDMILEFRDTKAPARDVTLSLRGFRKEFQIEDRMAFSDHSTQELQDRLTPDQVIEILREGNRRFQTGTGLSRDFARQVDSTAGGQNPMAVVLSCIDSRAPAELVLDMGLGDIFSVRVAGNVIGTKSLGSIEYGVGVAGVKLVLVMGHTRCGAVTSAVRLIGDGLEAEGVTGCQHLQSIVDEISPCINDADLRTLKNSSDNETQTVIDNVARRNVLHTVDAIVRESRVIREASASGHVKVVGALYDVSSGAIEFLDDAPT